MGSNGSRASSRTVTSTRKTGVARRKPTSVEICAGAGGTALGLELAGFKHVALVENDPQACETLRRNRPKWNVIEADVTKFDGSPYEGVDLLSGGVPCPPFSVAGKQLGERDERDLFPQVLRLARECEPKAVMVENVRGLLDPVFHDYRARLERRLSQIGYETEWKLLQASDFGVPQLRPRVVMVALRSGYAGAFRWPEPTGEPPPTVGEVLYKEMASCGWPGAEAWREQASGVAPTLVGGSKKHGGPDLGPTRARKAWAAYGVEGKSLANEPPGFLHEGPVRLTVTMTALLQGFPADWVFTGPKTYAYRQIGNAFPPPVASAVGKMIYKALGFGSRKSREQADGAAVA